MDKKRDSTILVFCEYFKHNYWYSRYVICKEILVPQKRKLLYDSIDLLGLTVSEIAIVGSARIS